MFVELEIWTFRVSRVDASKFANWEAMTDKISLAKTRVALPISKEPARYLVKLSMVGSQQ